MVELINKDGAIQNFEACFYRKDRSIFWARYSARIFPEKGWIEGVAEDITEHKPLNQILLYCRSPVKQPDSEAGALI